MQYSYGIIVFLRENSDYKVLLVQHYAGHWSFPKGHMQSKETPLQTARREVLEETGLYDVRILSNVYFEHYYSFYDMQRNLVTKKVGFFVGEVYTSKVILQKEELKDYCWKNFDEAIKLLTFESDKNIFRKAYESIKLTGN